MLIYNPLSKQTKYDITRNTLIRKLQSVSDHSIEIILELSNIHRGFYTKKDQ